MRYDELLRVRVPAELREKLQRQAKILQVPVSVLVRWALRYICTSAGLAAAFAGLQEEMGEESSDNDQRP